MPKLSMNIDGISAFCALAMALPSAAFATETITYTYDALGRLTQSSSAGSVNSGLTAAVTYDAAGNRKTYTATNATNPPPPANGAIVLPLNGFTVIPLYSAN